jgi:hypothetical protein
MRLAGFLLAAALAGGCGLKHSTFVSVDNVALGRVVVYRNGVAFYERRATVEGGVLTVSVPRDRVDDFLKSLTVVDAKTQTPLPVSIPRQQNDGAYLVMKLQLPSTKTADVVLTYVTEAPAWKPSYRVVVGANGKVMLEGWAIVDNTSGEDWKGVLVGVGSSSALSFKYDLWSVRQVQRETLQSEERFAIAPPTGMSPYGGNNGDSTPAADQGVVAELDDGEIRRPAGDPEAPRAAPPPPPQAAVSSVESTGDDDGDADEVLSKQEIHPSKKAAPAMHKMKRAELEEDKDLARDARVATGDLKLRQLGASLGKGDNTIVVEGYADANRPEAQRRANDRANIVKNQLIDQGIAPARIKVVTHVEPNQVDRVRLVAQAPTAAEKAAGKDGKAAANDAAAEPVGESHFANPTPMTVERGSSAMVSMVRGETDGEVVYLYDAESERGNDKFAFRAVRFRNPTDSTLETGPVTVYGNERFIGEGLTEPIPPKASAVVPYALDRQVVVERSDGDEDKISKLVTLQRGVLTAEVQHIKHRKLTVTNRMNAPARMYIRHTLTKGWTLLEAPPQFERVGDAHLFEVDLKPLETRDVMIAEATPIERTLDLNTDVTLDMMKVYIDAPSSSPGIVEQIKKLLGLHKNLVDLADEQTSLRRRLEEYRERMNELHTQIFTLTAVKTGGDLMTHLKSKMKDISDRVQTTTIGVVDTEEKIMLAKVQFQDALAELSLPDATTAQLTPAPTSRPAR